MRFISSVLLVVFIVVNIGGDFAVAQEQRQKKFSIGILAMDALGVPADEVSALSDRLKTELFNTRAFEVMERAKMEEILKEQGFQQTGCTSDACAVEVGQLIGVEKMIAGSIGKVGNTYTVNLRLIDVETGKIDEAVTEDCTGPIDRLLVITMRNIAETMANKVLGVERKLTPEEMKMREEEAKKRTEEEKGLAQLKKKQEEEAKRALQPKGKKKTWLWFVLGGAVASGGVTAALLLGGKKEEKPPGETEIPLPPPHP
ncbi:MAG: CsgG/HfaB family protein [Candidatus Edwardsbacteria bacterium]